MPKPKSCRFMKSHEWACLKDGKVLVGISDHAQKEITDVVFVELPKVGRQARQGEAVCVVESVKAAFDIYAPASGRIAAVNEALAKDPALINRSPHEEGWLFQIEPSASAELEALMSADQYEEFLKTDAGHASH
ncbi:MAG: glycine cleavage system protein GcvH [Elusimicrobia bacterium]|nr:glycine cleavage system protein GcvH [Elusimicrobiota bacterium]